MKIKGFGQYLNEKNIILGYGNLNESHGSAINYFLESWKFYLLYALEIKITH